MTRYRTAERPSRQSCHCDGAYLSYQCCGDAGPLRGFMLVFIPLALAVLYLFAGAYRLSVFKLDTGVVRYLIAAQGYKNPGGEWTESRYVYPAPPDWPKPIQDLPLWLLFHLILGILLGVYLLFLLFTYMTERATYKSIAILEPRWWSRLLSCILAGLCIALSSRDAAFWAQGAQVSKFTADIPGGFLVVVGIIFGVWWLLLLKPWAICQTTHTNRSSSRSGGYSSSRSRSKGYTVEPQYRSGRSNRGWWDNMTRA